MSNTVEAAPKGVRGAQVWPLSIEAYRALGDAGLIPEDTELLYGTVYRKMSKSPYHSALLRRLKLLLQKVLPAGFLLDSEQPITCMDSETEPDIAIIRGIAEDFWEEHPHSAEVIIEICVTSHDYDRSKLRAYASAGVKECWLVLGPEKQIEVYRQPKDGQYLNRVVYGVGSLLVSDAIPALKLSLGSVFERSSTS
jgi:Uma2 family endonuclease